MTNKQTKLVIQRKEDDKICGPWIHGRSSRYATGRLHTDWKHQCKPLEINAHGEFDRADDRRFFPATEPYSRSELLDAPEKIPIESLTVSTIDAYLEMADWGIEPWSGKPVMQTRGGMPVVETGLLNTIPPDYFFPNGLDLVRWMREHWGKRGDAGEFCHFMPLCLDIQTILHKTSLSAIDKIKARPIPSLGYQDIARDPHSLFPHPSTSLVSHILMDAMRPQQTFAQMFKDAPSRFWMEQRYKWEHSPQERSEVWA